MCGVVGYIGYRNASPILVNELRRLEYRGYDSAGVAVLREGGISLRRTVGKLQTLETLLASHPVVGTVGLGHRLWATHGRPSEENAHHTCRQGNIVVVHNDIIENYAVLKEGLMAKGYSLKSQADTEVLADLIEEQPDRPLRDATRILSYKPRRRETRVGGGKSF